MRRRASWLLLFGVGALFCALRLGWPHFVPQRSASLASSRSLTVGHPWDPAVHQLHAPSDAMHAPVDRPTAARVQTQTPALASRVADMPPSPTAPQATAEGPPTPTYWLRGIVRTPDNEPIQHFEIRFFPAYEPGASPSHAKSFASLAGEFELEWSQAGPVDLVARAPGFVEAVVPQVTLAAALTEADRWELVLVPGGRLQGRVVDEAGHPVSGATVEFGQYFHSLQALNPPAPGHASPETQVPLPERLREFTPNPWRVTDGDGRFEFTELPQGAYQLHGSHPDYFPASQEIAVSPGHLQQVQFVLSKRGGILVVHVTDLKGQPLAGQTVRLIDSPSEAQGTTDQGGVWRLEDLVPRRYRVALLPVAAGTTEAAPAIHIAEIEVKAGTEAHVIFQAVQGTEVVGTVDQAGQPVVGAQVQIAQTNLLEGVGADRLPVYAMALTRTDIHGQFAVQDLPPGAYELMMTLGAEIAKLEVTIKASDQHRTFQIHLGTRRVEGMVRDGRTGQAVAGADVRLFLLEPIEDQREDDDVFYATTARDVVTNIHGAYRIDHAALGRYLLDVSASTYGTASQPVELRDQQHHQDVTLWPSGQLVVTVTSPHRFPIRWATVAVTPLESIQNELVALTDANGLVHLSTLAPGAYEVRVVFGDKRTPFQSTVDVHSGEVTRLAVTLEVEESAAPLENVPRPRQVP